MRTLILGSLFTGKVVKCIPHHGTVLASLLLVMKSHQWFLMGLFHGKQSEVRLSWDEPNVSSDGVHRRFYLHLNDLTYLPAQDKISIIFLGGRKEKICILTLSWAFNTSSYGALVHHSRKRHKWRPHFKKSELLVCTKRSLQ